MNKIIYTFAVVMMAVLTVSGQTDTTKSVKEKGKRGGGINSNPRQNQEVYMKPDMQQKDWNYKDRNVISKPLMPKYDQKAGEMAFQTGKKRIKQQQAFNDKKYYYPAKPRNQWEIGLGVGPFYVSGDVKPVVAPFTIDKKKFNLQNIGGTFTVRKSIGYVGSIRFQYVYGYATGKDWEPKSNNKWNPALNGTWNPNINYFDKSVNYSINGAPTTSRNLIFANYRTQIHEVSLQGVFTLGNIRYHKERNRLNFYTFLGVGGMLYRTKMDALDENGNMYDFGIALTEFYSTSQGIGDNTPVTFLKNEKKANVQKYLNEVILDGKYESNPEGHRNEEGIKSYTFNPTYSVGLGLGIRATKRVTFNLETRVTMTNDDLIDGQRWMENGWDGHTRDFDNYFYSFVTMNFNLGKKATEPMWWLNPMDHTYKKLAEADPAKAIDDLLQDDDKDGVPNRLDKELNTKEGCPVDPKGIALDSDKDGIIDCIDIEPFSPPGFPIDELGKANVPCCADGGSGNKNKSASFDCDKMEMPSIHFEEDKYYVSPEYYAALHSIGDKMMMCPDSRVVITGIATTGKIGEQMAWNRTNKSIDYLVEKYGIDRNRFIVRFQTDSTNPQTTTEKLKQRRVEFRVAKPDETGSSNPPAPHPGLKVGSDK